jgi:hypothetical protein
MASHRVMLAATTLIAAPVIVALHGDIVIPAANLQIGAQQAPGGGSQISFTSSSDNAAIEAWWPGWQNRVELEHGGVLAPAGPYNPDGHGRAEVDETIRNAVNDYFDSLKDGQFVAPLNEPLNYGPHPE